MTAAKTAAAMAVGLLTTLLSVASFAQNGQDQPATANPTANATALILSELATVDWIEKSDVAALREGVIEKMELRLGDPALVSKPIGYLHREAAELTVAKNKILAESVGAIEKGKAAVEVAASRVARDKRLNDRKPGMVSAEDVAKDEGELKVADAQTKEAMENQHAAQAELALAREILKEHTIVAPFDGVVIKRYKNPGESVRANEAVVQIGKLSRLCRQRLRSAQACLQGQGRADRRDPAQGRFRRRRQGGDREPEVPGQDHLRRSPDPGHGRDRTANPGRV